MLVNDICPLSIRNADEKCARAVDERAKRREWLLCNLDIGILFISGRVTLGNMFWLNLSNRVCVCVCV